MTHVDGLERLFVAGGPFKMKHLINSPVMQSWRMTSVGPPRRALGIRLAYEIFADGSRGR